MCMYMRPKKADSGCRWRSLPLLQRALRHPDAGCSTVRSGTSNSNVGFEHKVPKTACVLLYFDFLDLLEGCPHLETLRAEKVTFTDDDNSTETETRTLHLPKLRLLKLGRAKASAITTILARLVIPECAIKLKVWMDRYDESKFHMGFPHPTDLDPTHPLRR